MNIIEKKEFTTIRKKTNNDTKEEFISRCKEIRFNSYLLEKLEREGNVGKKDNSLIHDLKNKIDVNKDKCVEMIHQELGDVSKQTVSELFDNLKNEKFTFNEMVKVIKDKNEKMEKKIVVYDKKQNVNIQGIDKETLQRYNDLANGIVDSSIFLSTKSIKNASIDTKLEEFSEQDYITINYYNPKLASKMLTDYNERVIPNSDISKMSNIVHLDNRNPFVVIDSKLSSEKATIKELMTANEYIVYPNPILRIQNMEGLQGNNDMGMEQDCGIASTSKGINDLHEKKVTSENRLVKYAQLTNNCDVADVVINSDGSVDYSECGATTGANVLDFFEANNIKAKAYDDVNIPSVEEIANSLKKGGVVVAAVNSDLMWHYEDAQNFDVSSVDINLYNTNSTYASHINTYMDMKNNIGIYGADHFVNVSNAVYDTNGKLSYFIISDTGIGKTQMIDVDYFERAYLGTATMNIFSKECVIAERRK